MKSVPPPTKQCGKLPSKGGACHDQHGGFYGHLALHRQGYSMRYIAKKLGIHRKSTSRKKSSLITKSKEGANRS
jgi:hypothetical protein